MIFSSYLFIFAFLPIVFAGFSVLRGMKKRYLSKVWLVGASLLFYGIGQPDFLGVFLASIVVNYLLLKAINGLKNRFGRGFFLLVAVLWNIGLLGYFKYMNFFLENINRAFHTAFPFMDILLPIGISFFTFQILAFTISLFRKEVRMPNLLDYMLYVTFFPQLIVGPVVKHEELMPQIEEDRFMVFRPENICKGTLLFSVGCAKKILIANPLIDYAVGFYGGSVAGASVIETWCGVMCYVFAYYFDFSGYIDMARGLGYLFGIELPVNFESPYKATDFGDFWRKWNITISRFFYESIYDNIFRFGDGYFKLLIAVMATFLVSGLWHGAGWHFVVWGAVNGVLVYVAAIRTIKRRKGLPKGLAILLTFFIGAVIRVLFDSKDLIQAGQVYKKMFDVRAFSGFGNLWDTLISFGSENLSIIVLLAVSAFICFALPNSNRISHIRVFKFKHAAAAGALLAVSIMYMTKVSAFLYFNF